MVKMHKLTKGGQTIFPATIYDAVVNPNTRKKSDYGTFRVRK